MSNELAHSKVAATVFNRTILEHLKRELQNLKVVHYWSDGAGSQLKNHFMFGNLVHYEADTRLKAECSFLETAHGKGPVD